MHTMSMRFLPLCSTAFQSAFCIPNDRGDVRIETLPVFPHGDRASCGVSTVTMVMQHSGLRLDTED